MRITFSLLSLLILSPFSFTQNCFNANLEAGTLEGFTAYAGLITEEGDVIIDEEGIQALRHEVVHISEGFDTIALRYCEINKFLPVVPKNGGQYTLRLGNSMVGAEAEAVVLRFKVTADIPFFQLRYAVVLNDPHHNDFEQPRFELRIADEKNSLIPCGEYKVKAAPEIPAFESCGGGWRVRPWTTVGFDLQPYIGQELQIEFLTTDCAQGGHAGYAYLEASCNPFKMEVQDFCPNEAMTTASVVDGYAEYLWNTGDTTTSINIPNPLDNAEYVVTITSITGCSFVMKDTLTYSRQPVFSPERNLTFCRDTQFWLTPKGVHLDSVYCPTLGLSADSFLIGTDLSHYTFISTNRNGCYSDTLSFSLSKSALPITATEDTLSCFGDNNGIIHVASYSDFAPFSYQWSNGASSFELTNLSAGSYTVTISDAIHCKVTKTLKVTSPPELFLNPIELHPITCNGMENAELTIRPTGGVEPYQFQWNADARNTNNLDHLGAGNYAVTVIDAHGCRDQSSITIIEPTPIILNTNSSDVSCFGGTDGTIELGIVGGIKPYTIFWEDDEYEILPYRNQIGTGDYHAFIEDKLGCIKEVAISIQQPSFNKACGTYIPNAFSPNGDGKNDKFFVAGSLIGIAMKSMQIFNRWGELVFESTGKCTEIGNPYCGWSGMIHNQPAPIGVYVYLIIIETEHHSKPLIYTGDLTLTK